MSVALAALATRFVVVALATFLAIIVWARLRDTAWMLIVVGVIAGYGDILYAMLIQFGFLPEPGAGSAWLGVLAFILPNVPWLCFSAAFMVMIAKRRRHRS